MPKVLFLVHGMGDNLPGWSSKLADFLDLALSQYPPFDAEQHPLRARVQMEEICYDPVFDKLLATWGQSSAELDKWTQDNGLKLTGTLNRLAAQQLPGDVTGFVWETLLDPVLYRGSPIIRDKVRDIVARQFVERWDHHLRHSTGTGQLDISVLCHSQGTIVMSDVLAMVGEARLPEFVPFSAEKRSINCLMTLANVSRLGPGPPVDIDSRLSCVRPQTAPQWKSGRVNYVKRFLNARNLFDPFCFWQTFKPTTDWGTRYQSIEIDHIHQANTHGYTHYLANPRVHIPLFRAVLGASAISPKAEQSAIAGFPEINPPLCNQAIQDLKQNLAQIRDVVFDASNGLDEWMTGGIDFYEAAKNACNACSSLVEGLSDD